MQLLHDSLPLSEGLVYFWCSGIQRIQSLQARSMDICSATSTPSNNSLRQRSIQDRMIHLNVVDGLATRICVTKREACASRRQSSSHTRQVAGRNVCSSSMVLGGKHVDRHEYLPPTIYVASILQIISHQRRCPNFASRRRPQLHGKPPWSGDATTGQRPLMTNAVFYFTGVLFGCQARAPHKPTGRLGMDGWKVQCSGAWPRRRPPTRVVSFHSRITS